jgi:hypothetical protein
MAREGDRTILRLVRPPKRRSIDPSELGPCGPQGLLFPLPDRNVLIFVTFPRVTEDEFVSTLRDAMPSLVLELRRWPRFDLGRLTRQQAFRAFAEAQAQYVDLWGHFRLEDSTDPRKVFDLFLSKAQNSLAGPIMVLLNENEGDESLLNVIAEGLASLSKRPWRTFEVPRYQ